jgi:hypothetical protein
MATVIILSHKAQNPLTANDHHTMTKVITTHSQILTNTAPNPLTTTNNYQTFNQETKTAFYPERIAE